MSLLVLFKILALLYGYSLSLQYSMSTFSDVLFAIPEYRWY